MLSKQKTGVIIMAATSFPTAKAIRELHQYGPPPATDPNGRPYSHNVIYNGGLCYYVQMHPTKALPRHINEHGVMNLSKMPTFYNSGTDLDLFLLSETAMKTLLLGSNVLWQFNVRELGKALRHNTTLETLSFSGTPLGRKGIEGIATGITGNSSLKTLDLSSVTPAVHGVLPESFKELLVNNDLVTGDQVAQILAPAIATNQSLESLNLSGNIITDVGAKAISDALLTNTSLTDFNLNHHPYISSELRLEIEGKLTINRANRDYRLFCQSVIAQLPEDEKNALFYNVYKLSGCPDELGYGERNVLKNLTIFWESVQLASLESRFNHTPPMSK